MSDVGNIDDFNGGDSVNLKTIDGQKFTIVDWQKSDYEDKGETTDGIKFTTEESFEGMNIFHTTRQVVVRKFYTKKDGEIIPTELGNKVKSGTKFPVKCIEVTPKKGGNNYFDLVSAKAESQETVV